MATGALSLLEIRQFIQDREYKGHLRQSFKLSCYDTILHLLEIQTNSRLGVTQHLWNFKTLELFLCKSNSSSEQNINVSETQVRFFQTEMISHPILLSICTYSYTPHYTLPAEWNNAGFSSHLWTWDWYSMVILKL